MKLTDNKRALTALVACVALGTTGGIAGSMAASSSSSKKRSTAKTRAAGDAGRRGHGGPGGPGGHGVHSESVVLNKAGTAFITRTDDEGTIKAISGNDVTITEGTKTVTYKDVTITIPDDATINRNGATAKVSDLKVGDRIHIGSSSEGTDVFAGDATFRPDKGGRGHGGTPPAGAPGA